MPFSVVSACLSVLWKSGQSVGDWVVGASGVHSAKDVLKWHH